MGPPTGQERRLRGYARLSRALFPESYLGKVFLVAFVGTHVPLAALAAYLAFVARPAFAPGLGVLLVALAATLAGTAGTLLGLWLLLTPVAAASAALRAYRLAGTRPRLPTGLGGEAGALLADVQRTLDHLDAAADRLAEQALRDPLTGLPNRRAFERRLAEELPEAARRGEAVALAAVDVDGLKGINDGWGHAAGDACLRRVAAALARHGGDGGWVARWGGDEFVAVVREGAGTPSAEAVLERVGAELAATPVRLPGGGEVALRVGWGVARGGTDPGALFARADAALYRAKRGEPPSPNRRADEGPGSARVPAPELAGAEGRAPAPCHPGAG